MRGLSKAWNRPRLDRSAQVFLASPLCFWTKARSSSSVGEESGHLEEMLLKAADIYDSEVRHAIDRAVALLVPLLTIGLGALIAAIIGSVLVAILSVNELAL